MKHSKRGSPFRTSAQPPIDCVTFNVAKLCHDIILFLLNSLSIINVDTVVLSIVFVDLNHRQIVVIDAKGLSAQNDSSFVFVFAVSGVGCPFSLIGPELPVGRTQDAVGGGPELAEPLKFKIKSKNSEFNDIEYK